jgi:LuxR family maltose regulon positive regulatory protein
MPVDPTSMHHLEPHPISHSVPSTKYRRPRLHAEMVSRDALVEHMHRAAMRHRVCLVRAPGGYGKTTLLTQLAERCDADGSAHTVWLSLDEGENDVNRLLLLLLCALQDLSLQWPIEPQLLASQVQRGGPQADAAVAIIVNALQSHRAGRLLIVLDDLHRVVDKAANTFIASLVDLLPQHVALLTGTRSEPGLLPIARWRLRGELASLGSEDLQFNTSDARRMLRRLDARSFDEAGVEQALSRTEGWAAGLQLILRAGVFDARRRLDAPGTDKTLFDYFANESFASLPEDLQDFLIRCSVLRELSPALCGAVTGRDDARAVLSSLAKQSLFLTAIDEVQPVLRLHDLYAAFLRHKLEQRGEDAVRALHARAAAAEQPTRAVEHWLAAHAWQEALRQMAGLAPMLLAEGGAATLMRWLASIPPAFVQRSADAQCLQAMVAATRWDFASATASMEAAMQTYRAEGRQHEFLTCAALIPRLCHAAGLLDKGAALLADADALPLDPELRLVTDAARLWQCLANQPTACARLLESIVTRLQANPALPPDAIENLNVPHFYGMPGALPPLRRLRELCERQRAAGNTGWQLAAMCATVWPEFWHGERTQVEAAMASSARLHESLAVLPTPRFNAMAERTLVAIARGDTADALRLQREVCEQMAAISPGFSATWERLIQFCLARALLLAGEHEELQTLWPLIRHPRTAFEYPVIDALRTRFEGHMARLAGDLVTAELKLEEAVGLEVHWRLPIPCADARPALALVQRDRGDTKSAWRTLSGLLDEMLLDDCIGPLLMESQADRSALIALIPAQARQQHGVRRLLARLAAWQAPETQPEQAADPLELLSPREQAVLEHLAAGQSNQLIADTLHISLHTVKRHVVNLLDKLGCDTRGQAAALWHANRA